MARRSEGVNLPLALGSLGALAVWIVSRFRKPQASTPDSSAPAPSATSGAPSPQAPAPRGSEAIVERLEPVIQPKARALLEAARAEGIELAVTQGLRTMEEQAALYAQGRTAPGPVVTNAKPGSSWHNFGLAFDVAVVVGGKPTWPNDEALWQRIGALGKAQGLAWGGDFESFKDRPHFQLTGGLTLADARAGKRPA